LGPFGGKRSRQKPPPARRFLPKYGSFHWKFQTRFAQTVKFSGITFHLLWHKSSSKGDFYLCLLRYGRKRVRTGFQSEALTLWQSEQAKNEPCEPVSVSEHFVRVFSPFLAFFCLKLVSVQNGVTKSDYCLVSFLFFNRKKKRKEMRHQKLEGIFF